MISRLARKLGIENSGVQSNTKTDDAERDTSFLSRHRLLLRIILGVLFAVALGIRIYHIGDPYLGYEANRQYASAQGARCMYYSTLDSVPEWKKELATIQGTMGRGNCGITAPLPTIEGIAYLLYRLAGGEYPWLPRLFSALSWLAGGVVLYLLAKKVTSTDAAVLSTAFYLLLPYSILASRSFQSEPLMVMAMLCSIYAIVLYNERPTRQRLFITGLIAAIAILVRPVCLFMIFGAFVLLTIRRQGLRKSISDQHSWLFAILAVFPTAVLHIYDYFYLSAGGLDYFKTYTFLPHLFFHKFFYSGWLNTICQAVGYGLGRFSRIATFVVLAAALFGTFRFRNGTPRALVIGLWCGYVASGLVFNYHIHTHPYFHIQLLPLVALCLGPVGASIVARVRQSRTHWLSKAAVLVALTFAVVISLSISATLIVAQNSEKQISIAETVGDYVGHSQNTVILAPSYGRPLVYHGWFSGMGWPHTYDFVAERKQGEQSLGAEERFYANYWPSSPDYFVVTDLWNFEKQTDLRELLTQTFPIVVQTEYYLIFDLRKTIHSE